MHTFPRSILALACISSMLPVHVPAYAFIDSSQLEESLEQLEQELSGDTSGLGGLLQELEEVSGEDADTYLQITVGTTSVAIWDVPKSAWFYSSVLALSELGIVSGYRDAQGNLTGAYGPADNVTREQALKIAVGAAGIDPASCGTPANRKHSPWAASYAACGEQRNFGLNPQDDLTLPATRAEVLHYLLMAFEVTISPGTPTFEDSKGHQYASDIAHAFSLGLISGDTNPDGSPKGTFRPDDSVNRAETAKMAKMAIELL